MAQNRRLESQNRYYTSTSNAYRLDEEAREFPLRDEPAIIRQEEPAAEPRHMARPKLRLRAVLQLAAVCAAVVAVAVVQIARYESMSAVSMRIAELKSNIADIENEIDELNVQLQYAMDINTAQRIARDSLDMDYPLSAQVKTMTRPEGTQNPTGAMAPIYAAVPISEAEAEFDD